MIFLQKRVLYKQGALDQSIMKKIAVYFIAFFVFLILSIGLLVPVISQAQTPEESPTPEITFTPTPELTIQPTPSQVQDTPTPIPPEKTPTTGINPAIEPTLTSEPTPTSELTPTSTPDLTTTVEATPSPTLTIVPTPEPTFMPEPPIDTTKAPASTGIGTVEGYGNNFEITDSGYLNLVTESTEEVYMKMESLPEMIVIKIRARENIQKTELKIFGWEPETTYHKYVDNYHNHEEIKSDGERIINLSIDLDAEKTKLIFIQPRPSTKFINATNGGDCSTFGTWNAGTLTCTMTSNLTETVQIDSNGITLDGNGGSLTASYAGNGNGIYIYQKSGITIKNLTIQKFYNGIYSYYQSAGNRFINNTVTQNTNIGIFVGGWGSNNNILTNNIVSNNNYYGINIYESESNTLTGNVMSGNKYNFYLQSNGSNDNQYLTHAIDKTNTVDGKAIYYLKNISGQTFDASNSSDAGTIYCIKCTNITIRGLSFSKAGAGVFFWKTTNSLVENLSVSSSLYGMFISEGSTACTIRNNNLSNSNVNLMIQAANNSTFSGNTLTGSGSSGTGMVAYAVTGATLSNNIITNHDTGLQLDYASNLTITGNQISNNYSNNLRISDCYSDSYCDHNIDNTNLLNGKILYYYKNVSNQTYDNLANPGMVFIYKGNNITVKNMTMDGVKTPGGVYFFKTNNSRIENIRVANNGYTAGMQLYSSNYNTVTGNNISNTYNYSIYFRYSSNNTITNNTITGSGNYGISIFYSSNNNQASGNTISNIRSGFYVSGSSNNTFTNNTARNNTYGFDHSNATYNTWNGNLAENNQVGGFDLYGSKNNTIINNTSRNNKYGIHLYSNAQNNIIYDNTFSGNAGSDFTGAGVYIQMYSGTGNNNNNQIYRNNFISNATQVKFETGAGTGNVFNLPAPTGGNYWSDWTGPDANSDGFIDVPYVFTNGSDALPRVCPGGSLNLDKAPPVTTATLAGDGGTSGWYRSNVGITLAATDIGSCGGDPSGVSKTEYSYNKINWTNYSAPFNITTEGEKIVYYRSVDNIGNIEGTGQETVNLINDNVTFPDWTVVRGTWVAENQEFSATGPVYYPTDAFASKGDLAWKNYTVELKFHPQNTTSWGIYLGTRYNGNPSPYGGGISRYAFILTGTQQLINKCVLGTCYGQNYLTNYPLSGNTWHTIKVELNGNKQRYYLNGTFYYEVTDSALASGSVFLQAYGSPKGHTHFDNILVTANQPIPPSSSVKIDKTLPDVSAAFTGTQGTNDWYVSDVTATITASDNIGVDKKEYSYDNSNWTDYTAPFILNATGETTVYYRAIDLAGNTKQDQRLIKIDKAPPTTTASLTGTEGNNNWYRSDVAVSLSAVDNEGGMDQGKIQYSFSNPDWHDYTEPLIITNEGTTTVYYRSIDSAGNVETSQHKIIKIDKTNPTITGDRTPNANDYNWNKENITVSFVCNDEGSGIADCTPTAVISSEGISQFVDGLATDEAGNTAPLTISGINIDKTLPEVTNITIPDANSFGWYNTDVQIHYSCTDSLSGPLNLVGDKLVNIEGANQSKILDCEDLAGNTKSTVKDGINIDKTPPTITGAPITLPNSNGWYKNDVTVHFTAEDLLSGIDTLTPDEIINSEGKNLSSTGTVTDKAGNSASKTVSGINLDKTVPVIKGGRTPVANSNGWNNQNVTVRFECIDLLSGKDGLTPDEVISSEGKDQIIAGTCTDKAGNSEISTVKNINIDKTAPEVTDIIIPDANTFGWYNIDIPIHYSCIDTLSGPLNTTGDKIISTEGANQSKTLDCVDLAGNTKFITQENINLDKTLPTISGAPTTLPNSNGWYKTDVIVHFEGEDLLSGIDTLTSDQIVSSEGHGQMVSGSVSDKAGNIADTVVPGINIDKTIPTIVGSRTPANEHGWNNNDVQVNFNCRDILSGVDACTPVTTIVSEGANQSVNGSAADKAGNMADTTVNNISIDKTVPQIAIGSPAPVDYLLNQTVLADWSVTDNLSQIKSSGGTVPSGQPISTNIVGLNNFKVSASDFAGNTDSKEVKYYVSYNYGGILQPVNSDSSSLFKLGRTVPIKFRLSDKNNLPISNAVAYLNIAKINSNSVGTEVEAVSTSQATEGNLFRYDPTENQYIFNLNTKYMSGGTWKLIIYLDDESTKEILISLK